MLFYYVIEIDSPNALRDRAKQGRLRLADHTSATDNQAEYLGVTPRPPRLTTT